MHLGDPVAQAVHDELQDVRVGHVQRVARPREVHVIARVGGQPVIGRVIDAAHRQRRPHLVALGRVVVDDVQDHLEARRVHRPDHHLELLNVVLRDARATVVGLRGQEAQRVVAPVVLQPFLDQVAIVQVIMHRQELDGRHAQVGQVLDGRLGSQPGIAAAHLFGHLRIFLGEPLHVQLINHGLVPGSARRTIVAPGERRIDDRGQRGIRGTVAVVEREVGLRVVKAISEELIGPAHVAADQLGIGVEHDLVGIEPVPLDGSNGP